MKNLSVFALAGLAAVVAAGGSLARAAAVDPDTANSAVVAQHAEQMHALETRMKVMQAQIERLRQTSDPAERSKLLAEHMQEMREQMSDMRALAGPAMHGQRGMGMGTGGGTGMGNGMGNGTGKGMGQGMAGAMQAPVPPETPVGAAAPKGPGLRHRMTEDRLDMMQMMMEQMMEQMHQQALTPPAAAAKPPGAAGR